MEPFPIWEFFCSHLDSLTRKRNHKKRRGGKRISDRDMRPNVKEHWGELKFERNTKKRRKQKKSNGKKAKWILHERNTKGEGEGWKGKTKGWCCSSKVLEKKRKKTKPGLG